MSERISLRRGEMPKAAARRPAKRPPGRVAREPAVRVPLGPGRMRRWVGGGIAALVVAGTAAGLWLAGVPQQMWFDTARSVGDAGFEVRHVDITGTKYLSKLAVQSAALQGPTNSMLLVDLDEIRGRLLTLPWVADASVQRRLPDTLVIDVAERKPAALWQYRRRLAVIDADGNVLTRQGLERFASLPMVVGGRANQRTGELLAMLAAHPDIYRRFDAAIWIGQRRWDLRFKTGETLALPEGDAQAKRALKLFAQMDEKSPLLEQGFARFDMRLGDKMVVRTSVDPGAKALPVDGGTTI